MDDVNQKKKMILIGIVCVGILAVVITIVLVVLQINEAAKLKVQVGNVVYKTKETQLQDSGSGRVYTQTSIIVDKQKNSLPFSVVTPEGNEYLNIKTFAEQFCGYVYNKGLYGGIPDESADKCHIVSKGEKVSFSANSNDLIKFLSAGTKYDGIDIFNENTDSFVITKKLSEPSDLCRYCSAKIEKYQWERCGTSNCKLDDWIFHSNNELVNFDRSKAERYDNNNENEE